MEEATVTAGNINHQNKLLLVGGSAINLESGWYGFCIGSQKLRRTCECSLSLVFETAQKKRLAHHKLPFHVNSIPVSSIEYGRLIYCTPDSIISVVHEANSSPCHYHKTNSSDWQWQLALRHATLVEHFVGGELTDRKNTIVCATCARPFGGVKAAQTHFNDHHKILSPIWNTPLKVLYDDEHFAVVDKPQGISVQGGEGKTLQRSELLRPLASGTDGIKPIIVHRLDAPTGGLLVCAKNKESERHLRMSFADHRCKKRYRAVVFGDIKDETGHITEPIGGKHAETKYQVVRRTPCSDSRADGWMTTVDLYPVSGRKHQIRRHLKHIGHPIWGDRRYAWYPKRKRDAESNEEELSEEEKLDVLYETTVQEDPHARLCLWAVEITVPHPKTEAPIQVTLTAEPEWISQLPEQQQQIFDASTQGDAK